MKHPIPKDWSTARSLNDAIQLVDLGIILKWQDMRSVRRHFKADDQEQVIRHFAAMLCERSEDRLAAEIIVESLLIWLVNETRENLVVALIDQIFADSRHDLACKALTEIALTSDVTDSVHDQEIFSMAVVLTCEIGIAIFDYEREYPGEFIRSADIMDHITTYLLSVSNLNSFSIRLSLLHYFGYLSQDSAEKHSFNRIINRFGHSVMEHLFGLLFHKKSEAVALQYLTENLPFVLEADTNCQRILHEIFKYYMLKRPDRFALFLSTFSEGLKKRPNLGAENTFVHHLGALFKVAATIHHQDLARDILMTLFKFSQNNAVDEISRQIHEDGSIRETLKKMLTQIQELSLNSSPSLAAVAQFRTPKRGRKPSFTKSPALGTMEQVTFLGNTRVVNA